MKAFAALTAAMLGLAAGMGAGARRVDDRNRERALRFSETPPRVLPNGLPFLPALPRLYRHGGPRGPVNRSQEQARRLRQRAEVEAKRALRPA